MKKKQLKDSVKLEWALLCSNALLDDATNNLSLVNVIEGFTFEGKRADNAKEFDSKDGENIPVNFTLVSRFRKLVNKNDVLNVDVKYEFVDPESKKLSIFDHSFEMCEGIKNFRNRYVVNGIKVTKSGLYNIVVKAKLKDENKYHKLTLVPLDINLIIT